MATYDVILRQLAETNRFTATTTNLTVLRGDIIRFIRNDFDGVGTTVTVSGFTTTYFTSSSSISLTSDGQIVSRTISAAAPFTTIQLSAACSGYPTITINVTIQSGIDSTPDVFSFLDQTLLQPGSIVESNQVTITGINVAVAVSVSSGSFMIGNDGVWRTSGNILNGQKLMIRATASGSYNTAVNITCTVGGRSDTWTLTTANDPGTGQVINFPITSGNIKLSDVINFFGGTALYSYTPPNNLRSYLKGGTYVPNITKNGAIASSGNLNLRDFLGSGTALYFIRYPGFVGVSGSTLASALNLSVNWNFTQNNTSDPKIGFGQIAYACEYRYMVVIEEGTVTSNIPNSIGVYSAWTTTPGISLSTTIPYYTEEFHRGKVYFQVRHKAYPTVVITAEAGYRMMGTGP